MKNVAYKTAKDIPSLPDGFIIEHFETNKDSEEGYFVVSKASFNQLIANNAVLVKQQDEAKGVVVVPQLEPDNDSGNSSSSGNTNSGNGNSGNGSGSGSGSGNTDTTEKIRRPDRPPAIAKPVITNKVAQAIDPDKRPGKETDDELFKQFLAWKKSQGV